MVQGSRVSGVMYMANRQEVASGVVGSGSVRSGEPNALGRGSVI